MQRPIRRGKTVTQPESMPYLRYADSADGISPRLIPGQSQAWYQANSYEHLPDSHTTEEAAERKMQVDKRARKEQTYFTSDFVGPTVFGDLTTADLILYSWGGTKGAITEALTQLTAGGANVAYLHFTHVHPLNPAAIKQFFGYQKPYLLIENNSTGQFGQLIKQAIGFETPHKLLKYDGRPIFAEEIVVQVQSLMGGQSSQGKQNTQNLQGNQNTSDAQNQADTEEISQTRNNSINF